MNAEIAFAWRGLRLWGPSLFALAAIGLQIAARPLIDENYLLLLFPAIAFGTLFGEVASTIVATVIGLIGVWFLFVPPAGPSGIEHHDVFELVVFGFTGVLLAVVTSRLRKSAAIAENARLDLEKRENDEKVRLLLRTATQGILSVDAGGIIRMANPASEAMFGYGTGELFGQPVDMLVPPGLRDRHSGHRATYMAAPRPRAMGTGLELVASRKDRSTFPVEVSLSHLATADGGLVVAFITDITERKKAADALRDRELTLRALTARLLTAQDDERRRVARELHDGVTQQLATVSIELGELSSRAAKTTDDLGPRLRAVQRRVGQVSKDVRAVSHALHPAMLEDLGLGAALETLCEEQREIRRVAIRFDGKEARDSGLDAHRAASLYRVAQEAIGNAVQHGHATVIDVAFRTGPDTVQLEVRDNGIGFDSNVPKSRTGLGLTSMRERIDLELGTLTVQSQPGQGTVVTAIVPLNEVAASEAAS